MHNTTNKTKIISIKENKKFKRVLVLSHNAFSKTQNNGKTLESFFSEWDKDKIAQIYLQPEQPDFEFCHNYFRITDYEALNNALFNGKIGHSPEINSENSDFINETSSLIKNLYLSKRKSGERKGLNKIIHAGFVKKIPILVALRDLIWSASKWQSNSLEKWIKEFSPEVLFFQGSNSVFGYKIALTICEKYKIPLILQLTDDYTARLYNYSVIEYYNKLKYNNILRQAINKSFKIITISDYMAKEYNSKFPGSYQTLMNSISLDASSSNQDFDNAKLIYAGNVLLKRWEVLKAIGKSLDEINNECNSNHTLTIHSPTPIPKDIIYNFSKIKSIICGKSLNKDELSEKIKESNILVHVESFDKKMRIVTRLSISTKIPEYLASNRCILAIGPSDVASIKYLSENNCAQISTDIKINSIKSKIEEIIRNKIIRDNMIMNSNITYENNHNLQRNKATIYNIINSATKDNSAPNSR